MTIRNLEPWNFEQIQKSNENDQDLPRVVQNIDTQQTPSQNNNGVSNGIHQYRVTVHRSQTAVFDVYAKDSDDAALFAREKGWQARDDEFNTDEVSTDYETEITKNVDAEDIKDELGAYNFIYTEALWNINEDLTPDMYFFGSREGESINEYEP